jgi:oligosaccharide repeat unit polymerase
MSHHPDTFWQITRLRIWFPAMPFILYWVGTFLLYHFGPLVNRPLEWSTHAYLFIAFTGFVAAYRFGVGPVGRRAPPDRALLVRSQGPALRLLHVFVLLGALGCLGFVADRLMSGAGSVAKTINETEFVREEYAETTTLLTTLSVIPYSFSLAGLALYFYACALRCKLSGITHGCALGGLILLCFNAFLSASRGNFFWVLTYIAFYFLFVKGESLRALAVRQRYLWHRVVVVSFAFVMVSHIVFIAIMRNNEQYLTNQARVWAMESRYGLDEIDIDPRTLGALLQLSAYGTHEFEFIDAFLARAEPLAFQPAFLLGPRVLAQINRVDPNYTPETVRIALEWTSNASLPLSAWPSVFGWLLVMFGYIGAPLFMILLGWVFGRMVGHFLTQFDPASVILAFCMFSALNMSFSWIGGDFPHNAGYLIGILLLQHRRAGPAAACGACGPSRLQHAWKAPQGQ